MSLYLKKVLPKKVEVNEVFDALYAEADKIAKDIRKDFEKIPKKLGWKHRVKFDYIVEFGRDEIEILVLTNDEIFGYQNYGTRSHIIRPKNRKALRWQGEGGQRFAKFVRHPGIQGQHWDEEMRKIWRKRFRSRMETALLKGAKNAGMLPY
jgi:hypothetical protein